MCVLSLIFYLLLWLFVMFCVVCNNKYVFFLVCLVFVIFVDVYIYVVNIGLSLHTDSTCTVRLPTLR